MTALITAEQLVNGLAIKIENGVDTNTVGDNKRLKDAMVSKNFFTGTTSDYRLKTNVTTLDDGVVRVKQLVPRQFNWLTDTPNTDKTDGFIAHEVAAVVPDAVTGTKDQLNPDGTQRLQTLDHSKLVPVLTAAVKELIQRVETLEAQLAALKQPG